jgi:hypothetical protein
MKKDILRLLGLFYLMGVGLSTLVAFMALVMNWAATELLKIGYSLSPFIPGVLPYTIYWSGTLLAVFVVGPPLFTGVALFFNRFHF